MCVSLIDLRLLGGAKELRGGNALLVCRAPALPLQLLPAWPDAAPPAGQAEAAARGRQLGGQRGGGEGGDNTIAASTITTFAQTGISAANGSCQNESEVPCFVLLFLSEVFFFIIPLFSFSVLAFPAVRRSWWKNIPEKVNVSQEDRSAWKKNSKV